MVDEIYNDLKKTYDSIKLVLAAKELSIEMEGNETEDETYDIPLLTIYYKDLAEEVPNEYRLLQVRVRKFKDYEEELVIVMSSNGATKKVENIEEDLKSAAEMVEKATEEFLLVAPDIVYRWEWLGDRLTQ